MRREIYPPPGLSATVRGLRLKTKPDTESRHFNARAGTVNRMKP